MKFKGQLFFSVDFANVCLLMNLIGQFYQVRDIYCVPVRLSYSYSDITGRILPGDINVTLMTDNGTIFDMLLRHIQQSKRLLPVYTVDVDQFGRYVQEKVDVKIRKNTAFYQDTNQDSIVKVTRINDVTDKMADLMMEGQVLMPESLHLLTPRVRINRDVGSRSWTDEHQLYDLEPMTAPLPGMSFESIVPPNLWRRPNTREEADTTINLEASTYATTRRRRGRRSTVPTYTIDTVVFVDFSAYQYLSHGSTDAFQVMNDIFEYAAFIMDGVDASYQTITTAEYKIRVTLIRIVVAKSAQASQFTEQHTSVGAPWKLLNTELALQGFQEFLANDGADTIKAYDHVVLFSAYNLATFSNGTSDKVVGLAAMGGLCSATGESSSIIEIIYEFSAITTTAHEMGHNLGAAHDGEDNNCTLQDRFIMAPSDSPETPGTRLNPWRFSPCSTSSFTSYINAALESTQKSTCLTGTLSAEDNIPKVKGLFKLSHDQQCARMFGEGSVLCRTGKPDGICRSMMCKRPHTEDCTELAVAPGSLCGSGKVCQQGECVYHRDAPHVPEDCVFGDTPITLPDGRRCHDAITAQKYVCYQELIRQYCCGSCGKVYRMVLGCEYGDLTPGCDLASCAPAFAGRNSCCETCNLGMPFTKLAQTTLRASTRSKQGEDAGMTSVNSTADKGNKNEMGPPEESGMSRYLIVLPTIALLCLACYGAAFFFRKKKKPPPPPSTRIQVDLLKFAPVLSQETVESEYSEEVEPEADGDEDETEVEEEKDDEEEELPKENVFKHH